MFFRSKWFAVVIAICTTLAIYPSAVNISSMLETAYHPVVEPMKITSIKADGPNAVIIEGSAKLNRKCTYEGVSWYQKGTSVDIAIPFERLVPRKNTHVGVNSIGPWKIFVNINEFKDNMYAKTVHRCHIFYPSESILYSKGSLRNED